MAESVDEERFHDTFEVVKAPVIHGIGLGWVNKTLSLITKVLVHWKVVKYGVYN